MQKIFDRNAKNLPENFVQFLRNTSIQLDPRPCMPQRWLSIIYKYIFCRNDTDKSLLANTTTTTKAPPSTKAAEPNPIAEIRTGHEAEEQQQSESMKIFFILIVLGL